LSDKNLHYVRTTTHGTIEVGYKEPWKGTFIFESKDKGVTWENCDTGEILNALALKGNTCYGIGDAGTALIITPEWSR